MVERWTLRHTTARRQVRSNCCMPDWTGCCIRIPSSPVMFVCDACLPACSPTPLQPTNATRPCSPPTLQRCTRQRRATLWRP